jgi:hypothetical protein
MPTDMTRYPHNWYSFSRWIRTVRANSQCECHGECGWHAGKRCEEVQHSPAHFARGRVKLNTAHTCACDPPCNKPSHVIAMCQACHLRMDKARHAQTREHNRHLQAERAAALQLHFPEAPAWSAALNPPKQNNR